jgi:hypothetical protein
VREVAMTGENEQRLREHGLIVGPELPSEYSDFIETLEAEEVDMIIDINRRAIEASLPTAPITGAIVPL